MCGECPITVCVHIAMPFLFAQMKMVVCVLISAPFEREFPCARHLPQTDTFFYMILRIYNPKSEVVKNTYAAPPMVRITGV